MPWLRVAAQFRANFRGVKRLEVHLGKAIGCGLCLWLLAVAGLAQVPGEVVIPPLPPEQWVPTPADRFDLVFNRTFIAGDASEGFELSTTSGTTFVGTGFSFHFNKRYSIRAQPGMAFLKFNLRDNDSSQVQLLSEAGIETFRLRVFYAELPVAFAISFRSDSAAGEKVQSLLEVGATIGYRVSSSIKYEQTLDDGLVSKVLINNVYTNELEPLRYGAFVRFSYRFFGLMVYYRFSDIFKDSASTDVVSTFPTFAPLEIGLSIHW